MGPAGCPIESSGPRAINDRIASLKAVDNGGLGREMSRVTRRKALIFLALALATTLVIGAALPRLRFQPGLPLPRLEIAQGGAPLPVEDQFVPLHASRLLLVLLAICLGAFSLFGLYRLLRGARWGEILSRGAYFLLALVVVFGLVTLAISLLPGLHDIGAASLPAPKGFRYSALGPAPPVLLWLVGLGLLAALTLLAFVILRSRPTPESRPWALEAEAARQALLAGEELADVIVHCYRRMSQALQEERGLVRDTAMTTGEFERLLVAQGVPRDPVHQLTQLFEAVRYGRWQPGAGDEQRALDSLDAILAHGGRAAKGVAE
jgi:hypothetical protein